MIKKKFLQLALLIVSVLILIIFLPIKVLTPINQSDADYLAIQKTLQQYMEIKSEMNFLGDGSGLAEVLANDRRGGWQPGYMIHAVRVMKGKPDLPESQIGLLDYYMARHEFNQRVMQYAQEAAQQGLLKIPTQQPLNSDSSNSVRPTPTPMPEEFERMQAETNLSSVPKIKALEQATGWIAQLPRPLPADLNPIKCQIWNIDIVGSTAIAWVDWDHALERDTLIKKDGKWFLVGQRIIVGHGN